MDENQSLKSAASLLRVLSSRMRDSYEPGDRDMAEFIYHLEAAYVAAQRVRTREFAPSETPLTPLQ